MASDTQTTPNQRAPQIVIAGAGSIGCFVGGLLAASGRSVTLLGRSRVLDEIRAQGLTLTDYAGLDCHVPASALTLTEEPACLARADLILVSVKSGATPDMARLIAENAPSKASVVSLQNGVENGDLLAAALPDHDVRAGMVAFNVVPSAPGHFHRAVSGDIQIGNGPTRLSGVLSVPALRVIETPDIGAVQWGKLLLNLNNALNALSGLTLHMQLQDRAWRRLMADQMSEALSVLRASGIAVRSTTPLPAALVPYMLRIPTPIFRRLAAPMLTIDPSARASMSYDLMQNRPTEVGALQGKVIALGQQAGVATPLNARIAHLIGEAERQQAGSPNLTVEDIRSAS